MEELKQTQINLIIHDEIKIIENFTKAKSSIKIFLLLVILVIDIRA